MWRWWRKWQWTVHSQQRRFVWNVGQEFLFWLCDRRCWWPGVDQLGGSTDWIRSGSLLFPSRVDALQIKLSGILYSKKNNHTFIICCTHFSAVHLFLIKDAFGRMAAKTAPNPLLPTEWGPSRHIVPFCPLEHYPRGHFRTFCPLEGVAERQFSPMFCPLDRHLKKNTFNMFNSTRRAAEGELCVCLLLEAAPKWALHQSEGNS